MQVRWSPEAADDLARIVEHIRKDSATVADEPRVMQEEVMSPDQAWAAYRALRSDRRIGYLPEPQDLGEMWGTFTDWQLSSPNLWTDAYLCAFA